VTRFSLDTNILVYSVDGREARQEPALAILAAAARGPCVLTLQSLGEFFWAVSRKGIIPRAEAAGQVRRWSTVFPAIVTATPSALHAAISATATGRFAFWDAMLLATADEAGCEAVISEDMAPGAAVGGVRVVGAFDPLGGVSADARSLLGL
jgi:predicted nucleic acid-binding protein